MLAKKHEHQGQTVLAVCDKEHLGKNFEEGNISFTVSEKFFNGKIVNEEELTALLEEATTINLFGNKCVDIAKRQGLINENTPIVINGIKHAQVYLI